MAVLAFDPPDPAPLQIVVTVRKQSLWVGLSDLRFCQIQYLLNRQSTKCGNGTWSEGTDGLPSDAPLQSAAVL